MNAKGKKQQQPKQKRTNKRRTNPKPRQNPFLRANQQIRAISVPVARNYSVQNQQRDKPFQIQHRELVEANVSVGRPYLYQVHVTNPELFPWLSQLSWSYERYSIQSLEVEYIPSCPTTTAGMIYLAYDYDPADTDDVVNPYTLASMYGTVSGNVFGRHTLRVDASRFRKFYNTGLEKQGTSVNDYKAGNILVYTTNTSAAEELGQLYIKYHIKLTIPCYSSYLDNMISNNSLATYFDPEEGNNAVIQRQNVPDNDIISREQLGDGTVKLTLKKDHRGIIGQTNGYGTMTPSEELLPTLSGQGTMSVLQNIVADSQTIFEAFINAVKGDIITFNPSNNGLLVRDRAGFALTLLNKIITI